MDKYRLKLFVTNHTGRSRNALENLRSILAQEFDGRYELEVIDVLDDPQAAENYKILATPTVIKELPPPVRRIIGDLSDRYKVLMGLDLESLSGDRREGTEDE